MPTGRQRLAAQQIEQALRGIPEDPSATVTAVEADGATDGLPLVTVNYHGASLQLRYLTSYTPVVGHVVVLGRNGGDWYIQGRLGGFPPPPGGA